MAEMDEPTEPTDSDNVSDLFRFAPHESPEALAPDELSDGDFARYRLAVWAHPSSLPRILETIERDLIEDNPKTAPSIERLRALMIDPRFEVAAARPDPYAENFEKARQLATQEQLFALRAVQRLHIITISSDLEEEHPDPHVRVIVEAILREQRDAS